MCEEWMLWIKTGTKTNSSWGMDGFYSDPAAIEARLKELGEDCHDHRVQNATTRRCEAREEAPPAKE